MISWLARLGVDTAGFDRAEFYFHGLTSRLTWALIALLILAGLAFARSSVRDLPSRSRRWFLIGLQLATIALLVLIALQPAVRLAKLAKVRERAVVLCDTSASMTLPGAKGSRSQEAAAFFSSHADFVKRLEEDFAVSYYGFDCCRY